MAMQTYGNGLYVAITTDGIITYSTDGINWGPPPVDNFSPAGVSPFKSVDSHWSYNGIEFGGGQFLAYGKRIIIVGTALPGSSWLSSLTVGGNWNSATFNGSNWLLTDDEGRTATSSNPYPGNWRLTGATRTLPPSYEYDPLV